ncbi:hypothetical protein D3C85_996140 [compost metagenome]
MEKRIYKYEIHRAGTQVSRLPYDAEILSVGAQGNSLVLWALVDPLEQLTEDRVLTVLGTGHSAFEPLGLFIGTVQFTEPGPCQGLVFHVFEG